MREFNSDVRDLLADVTACKIMPEMLGLARQAQVTSWMFPVM